MWIHITRLYNERYPRFVAYPFAHGQLFPPRETPEFFFSACPPRGDVYIPTWAVFVAIPLGYRMSAVIEEFREPSGYDRVKTMLLLLLLRFCVSPLSEEGLSPLSTPT